MMSRLKSDVHCAIGASERYVRYVRYYGQPRMAEAQVPALSDEKRGLQLNEDLTPVDVRLFQQALQADSRRLKQLKQVLCTLSPYISIEISLSHAH